MDFFSGLKKAYDSLGEEFTKTFDSSQSGEDTATSGGSPREQDATPRSHRTSPGPTSDGDQPSVYTTPLAVSQKVDQSSQDDEGWGKWEDQPLMSATTKTKEVHNIMHMYHGEHRGICKQFSALPSPTYPRKPNVRISCMGLIIVSRNKIN